MIKDEDSNYLEIYKEGFFAGVESAFDILRQVIPFTLDNIENGLKLRIPPIDENNLN